MSDQPATEHAETREPPQPPERTDADETVLPDVANEDRDEGWGDPREGRRDEQWYRRERPPHHE